MVQMNTSGRVEFHAGGDAESSVITKTGKLYDASMIRIAAKLDRYNHARVAKSRFVNLF